MVWRIQTREKKLYYTFDDGPHPDITPKVLDLLDQHNAFATFFCTGKNAVEHPGIVERIKEAGHSVGHHTVDHVNGWSTGNIQYYRQVLAVPKSIRSRLFRPPYGKITNSQAKRLQRKFRIIMWDVLSGDFDEQIDREKCLNNVIKNVDPGSIVVFHDSAKAERRMLYALERSLDILGKQGYVFEGITDENLSF